MVCVRVCVCAVVKVFKYTCIFFYGGRLKCLGPINVIV